MLRLGTELIVFSFAFCPMSLFLPATLWIENSPKSFADYHQERGVLPLDQYIPRPAMLSDMPRSQCALDHAGTEKEESSAKKESDIQQCQVVRKEKYVEVDCHLYFVPVASTGVHALIREVKLPFPLGFVSASESTTLTHSYQFLNGKQQIQMGRHTHVIP